ncbi:transposase [Mesorhizobium sp. L103C131B0]|uniref:transposase n=2 Tax=Mesorhizobium TaxID=68287 RepID=UPI0032AEEC60
MVLVGGQRAAIDAFSLFNAGCSKQLGLGDRVHIARNDCMNERMGKLRATSGNSWSRGHLLLRELLATTTHHLRNAEFATLRLRLLKLGARVIETVSRIRLAFAAACPEASLFRAIASNLLPAGP